MTPADSSAPATPKTITLILWLALQNGSKFTRGKKKAREEIEACCLAYYAKQVTKTTDREYELILQYQDEADLKTKIDDLIEEIHRNAEARNCMAEFSLKEKGTDLYFWS